jgi:hypothetical protein
VIKLIWIAVLASIACRLLSGMWPWELLGRADRSAEEARARALLGVSPGAGREDIIEAHRRLIALVHPDKGGSDQAVHEANAARDLLLARTVPRNDGRR